MKYIMKRKISVLNSQFLNIFIEKLKLLPFFMIKGQPSRKNSLWQQLKRILTTAWQITIGTLSQILNMERGNHFAISLESLINQ
jgi:hypothetical protein